MWRANYYVASRVTIEVVGALVWSPFNNKTGFSQHFDRNTSYLQADEDSVQFCDNFG